MRAVPAGVCIGDGLCMPVVYVVTRDDRYFAYDLVDAST